MIISDAAAGHPSGRTRKVCVLSLAKKNGYLYVCVEVLCLVKTSASLL